MDFHIAYVKLLASKLRIGKPSSTEALYTSVQHSPLLDGVRSRNGPACSAIAQHHLKAVLTWGELEQGGQVIGQTVLFPTDGL